MRKIKKLISVLLVFALCVSTDIFALDSSANTATNIHYLSDLDWYSAIHGDALSSKTVQKDHPFTQGNNGQDTKISLKMPDGTVREFDKGLGTVAASPSVITYNVTGAGVTNFHAYVGIDRSATGGTENYAEVEKIEIVVDEEILYTTITDYPEGIDYETAAIEVNLTIPDGAKRLELKSYAGTYTWSDEVVFADAKVEATGTFPDPDDWTVSTTYYLSDLDWYSATHGDALSSKTVQKDHPFTQGNNGQDTKISLKMPDGTVREFDKGLGTVAANPSVITYNVTGAGVTNFHAYVGIDRSATGGTENYAEVEKIEIVVDEEILYTTITDYPEGIDYETAAIEVNLTIPEGAKKLELKSYAGTYTWSDEVVFADARVDATGIFPDPSAWLNEFYLSDIAWITATHGDSTTSKTVQRDHPFTLGNNGQNTKISLKMSDETVREFDKGLGTVAGSPSVISYDISGKGVSEFHAYVGIDRSANGESANHAEVEKIEIVVDEEILYTSIINYPDGVLYDTTAIEVNLTIPEDAQTLELKSYAGMYTWADEVVFADAKIISEGLFENINDWQPAPRRREVSNEQPLLMMPLYADGTEYSQNERQYGFWGDDTLTGKWEAVPNDLKPYTVIELHPDDLPMQEGSAADFYEHFLQEAENYVNPSTGENEPIPIVLTVYTAGNQSYYTAAHWLTIEWIESMYEEYTCLQGIFCTENYWVWASGIESMAAQYLEISAKHGGLFIWSEQNNGAAIEKAMGTQGQTALKEALEQYSDYFIFMYKNTPAAEGNDAPTASYMEGLWLTDYAYQWGGLMDTWKWYETGKWKLFESDSIGKTQGNRQWLTEPEALVGIEALTIYLNGGCVYNFEHPAYTYGVRNEQSPLYKNVIQEFFRYVIENPAPSKAEMLSKTKILLRINYSEMGNGDFFVGLNTEMAQTPTYTTGRYGLIPAVPKSISTDKLMEKLTGSSIEIIEQNDSHISSLVERKEYFNSLYNCEYEGDIFAQKVGNTWFLYNYKYNTDIEQTCTNLSIPGTGESENWTVSATLKPHTSLILEGTENAISVRINNYRTNKDELWEGASTAGEAQALTPLTKQAALDWIYTDYINNTQDQEKRTTVFTITGLESQPIIRNVVGLEGNYTTPQISYDSENNTATVTINCNGYVYFTITE